MLKFARKRPRVEVPVTCAVLLAVLFQSCCQRAVTLGVDTFIECGPGRTLSGMIRRMDRTLAVSNYDTWDDFS